MIGFRSTRIGRKLLTITVTLSGLLAAFFIAGQLWIEFRTDKEDLQSRTRQIGESAIDGLGVSVWNLDDQQVSAQLAGLLKNPGVIAAEIAGETPYVAGDPTASENQTLETRFPITHSEFGETHEIGELVLVTSTDAIVDRLAERSVTIVAAQLLKTLIFAALFLAAVSFVVARRVDGVSKFAESLDAGKLSVERLETSYRRCGPSDEIDDLATTLSRLEVRLLEHRQERERYEQRLEAEVESRTSDLEIAVADARTAERAKGEFLANMSHEIRTPLSSILGFTELIEDTEPTEEQLDLVRTIRRSGEHLLGLINDILDLSRLEANRLPIEIRPCSIRELVAEVVELVYVRVDASRVELCAFFDPSIPEQIESDPTRLRQILLNVVGNAAKFTDDGSIRVDARAHANPAGLGGTLELDVVDTGIGLDEEAARRVFETFEQADTSTTRRFGGTGLGLAVSQRLAELLGGDLRIVQSELEVGTTFRLTLPLVAATTIEPKTLTPAAPARPDRAGRGSEGCRVLVAEDGADNQRILRHFLERAGCRTTIVENGRLAVDEIQDAVAQGHPYDIVLMDMQMPVLDGYAATRELRELGFERPIIAVTAHAMTGDQQKCEEAGCSGFVTKPIRRERLYEAMVAELERQG